MLKIKTDKTYSEAVRDKYLIDKESNKLRGELLKLTPANIRKLCLRLIDEGLSESDKKIFKNNFGNISFDEIRNRIKKYDIDGFRPICKFLKKENDSLASHDNLELTAILVDYKPRPYTNYKDINLDEEVTKENKDFNKTTRSDFITTIKSKNQKPPLWIDNILNFKKSKKIILGILFSVIIIITINYVLKDQTRWMIWNNDHYVEVKFDDKKYSLNQLKLYKEDRIKFFKKIDVTCDTIFFNIDGSVRIWYGKNNEKALEYFTSLGLHPETGKTLKPITKYMIDKHICND